LAARARCSARRPVPEPTASPARRCASEPACLLTGVGPARLCARLAKIAAGPVRPPRCGGKRTAPHWFCSACIAAERIFEHNPALMRRLSQGRQRTDTQDAQTRYHVTTSSIHFAASKADTLLLASNFDDVQRPRARTRERGRRCRWSPQTSPLTTNHIRNTFTGFHNRDRRPITKTRENDDKSIRFY
jgi:hypothetical protein